MNLRRTQKQIIGTLGEGIASKYLVNKGFIIITRNYRKKFGEIDIVAKYLGVLHFIEVKTVSCEKPIEIGIRGNQEDSDRFRPEDNVHFFKLKRLSRVVQVYLSENKISDEDEWQFDVVTVLIDENNKTAKVSLVSDLIL